MPAGALAEMCGAAKHKPVKLSVSAAVASMALLVPALCYLMARTVPVLRYCMWKKVPGLGYESQVFASGALPMPGLL
jgi:hypothetical protein